MLIRVKQATKDGYEIFEHGVCDLSQPSSKTRRGRVQRGGSVSPTITTTNGVCKIMSEEEVREELPKLEDYLYKDFGVFKLTPRECLRLMNVTDQDIDKMMKVNSQTQCYKQAGNSIVVAVLCGIFSQLNIQGVKAWNDRTDEERAELFDIRENRS